MVVDAVDRQHHIAAEPKLGAVEDGYSGAVGVRRERRQVLIMAGTTAASIAFEIFIFSLPF